MISNIMWTLPRPPASKYIGLSAAQLAYVAALIDGEGEARRMPQSAVDEMDGLWRRLRELKRR